MFLIGAPGILALCDAQVAAASATQPSRKDSTLRIFVIWELHIAETLCYDPEERDALSLAVIKISIVN